MNASVRKLSRARKLRKRGAHSQALATYTDLLAGTPSTSILLETAECALKVNPELAHSLVARAIELNPREGIAIHLAAEAQARMGDLLTAEKLYRQAIALNGNLAELCAFPEKSGREPWIGRFQAMPCNLCGETECEQVWIGNASKQRQCHGIIDPIKLWVKCTGCGIFRVQEPPPASSLRSYREAAYETDNQAFHKAPSTNALCKELLFCDRLIERVRQVGYGENWVHRNRTPGSSPPQPRLLDVGASWGVLVAAARWRGFVAEGIDTSTRAVQWARKNLGINIGLGEATADLPEGPFDVITMWELLEHLADPGAFLEAARDQLEPGGILAISTPSTDHPAHHAMGYDDPGWGIPDHLHYFDRRSLATMLVRHGFQPMGSWYSEKTQGSIVVISQYDPS